MENIVSFILGKMDKIVSFTLGVIASLIVFLCGNIKWDFSVNIIDLLMLIATIVLSIYVIFLTKRLEKNDIVRDIVIRDIEKLCEIYQQNTTYLKELEHDTSEEKKSDIRKQINLVNHHADMQIDKINQELQISFPKFFKKIGEKGIMVLTMDYIKWLTGGELMESKNFIATTNFLKEHDTKLYDMTSKIHLLIPKLIKHY